MSSPKKGVKFATASRNRQQNKTCLQGKHLTTLDWVEVFLLKTQICVSKGAVNSFTAIDEISSIRAASL
jgi:hypothetical protein